MKIKVKIYDTELEVFVKKVFIKDNTYYFVSSVFLPLMAEYFHPDHIIFSNQEDKELIDREFDISQIIR